MSTSTFGTIKTYYKNEIIFKEGQSGNHGFLIKSGEVTVYRMADNQKTVLNVLKPGEVFGEMGVIMESPRTANAVASEYCELVVIDKNTMLRMLSESPKVIQSITHVLIKRLMHVTEMVSGKEGSEFEEKQNFFRICHLLCFIDKFANTTGTATLSYNEFCNNAIDILGVSRVEIDNTIKRVSSWELLELSGDLREKSDSKIKIAKPDEFMTSVKKTFESLSKKS